MIGTNAPSLPNEQAIREIGGRPGLIPVDIDLEGNRLVWMDMGDTRLEEGYFFLSTQRFLEQNPDAFTFSTGLEPLDEDDYMTRGCYPTAFIYHMGRCGSTLLSKALSRVLAHLVISEAPPHYFVWPLLQGGWQRTIRPDERNIRRFRNLTLAMGRRRRDQYRAHFVKFTSYNVLFFDFIQSAFPDVPSLFLYRHPAEVLVSLLRQGTGWGALKNSDFGAMVTGCTIGEVKKLSGAEFYARCLGRFMTAALAASAKGLSLANYNLLKRETLPAFFAPLQYQAEAEDLLLMQEQFDYYSKDESGQKRFVPDSAGKKKGITPEIDVLIRPELLELYRELESAETNLSSRLA